MVATDEEPAAAERGSTEEGPAAPSGPRRRRWLRLMLVLLLFVGLLVVGRFTSLNRYFDPQTIRATVERAGAVGVLIYVAIFAAGELLHIPGMVFVAAGVLAYGRLLGFAATLLGSLVSVTVSFWLVRVVGGKALQQIDRPLLARLLARVQQRPLSTVILLRLIFWLLPALNYALALSGISFRVYLIGSVIGLVPPIVGATLVFDWLLS